MSEPTDRPLAIGDPVEKCRGYAFTGRIIAILTKLDGSVRYVVENDTIHAGLCMIYSGEQLRRTS